MRTMRTQEKRLMLNRETLRHLGSTGGPVGIEPYSEDTRCFACTSHRCPPVQER